MALMTTGTTKYFKFCFPILWLSFINIIHSMPPCVSLLSVIIAHVVCVQVRVVPLENIIRYLSFIFSTFVYTFVTEKNVVEKEENPHFLSKILIQPSFFC